MIAVCTKNPAAVRLLWKHRAKFDLNAVNCRSYSVLHLAAEHKWLNCISALLEGGADINKQGKVCKHISH